jgi:small-conductance mechanosensitive channel
MQTTSDSHSHSPAKQKVVTAFRLGGWIAFWLQLGLAVASCLVLLFAVSGRNFSSAANTGISIGIFWAVCGVIVLCFNVYLAFRYTRIAKLLLHPNPDLHPKKADTLQILRVAVIVGLVGILLSLLGAGATVGVLVAKSVSQPPGVAITDPNKIIRALDVFVEVANINGIAGHFIGVVTSVGLLNWLNR